MYKNRFINESNLSWFSKRNRTTNSKEIQKIIHAQENDIDVHIFVKKDDDEGTDFYYLGEAISDKKTVEQREMWNDKGKKLPVVQMELLLENPVEDKLYRYLKAE